MHSRYLSALALLYGLLLSQPGRGAGGARFVDDRGSAIRAPLEACFQVETRTECSSASEGRLPRMPEGYWAVRIEGPDHGPLTLQRSQIRAGGDGMAVVQVPRKAELRIEARPGVRLTVSVYPQEDPSFRPRVFGKAVQGGEPLKIPAGDSLVSLVSQS